MLRQVAHYNDFSPEFIEKLEEKINKFGKIVRYRFDIEKENPDKTYYNGKMVFPQTYTLDPTVFSVRDEYEKRPGKAKLKTVANIKEATMNEHGVLIPTFNKIRVTAGMRGILRLDLTKEEDKDTCMICELHPKLKGGEFADSDKVPVFSRIDEQADATAQRTERTSRLKALNVAQEMSDAQVREFAAAMLWDDTQDMEVLRNEAETLADSDPVFFNDLVEGKTIEALALSKRALDMGIIVFDPAEYKMYWGGNKQTVVMLNVQGDKNEVQKFADWLLTGDKGADVFKKLKSLTKEKALA